MDLKRRTLLKAGGLAAAGSALPRWTSASAEPAVQAAGPAGSWLLGDTHVHSDHSSDGSGPRQATGHRGPGNVPVSDQIAQGERMGLDWMPVTDHRNYDQHWHPGYQSAALLLIPGEEANGSPHATIHGHVEQRVDGAEPAGSTGYRHIQQSIWDVAGQDACWSTAHPDDGEVAEVRPDGSVVVNANAHAVGLHLIEILNLEDSKVKIRYAEDRWNAGFRLGVGAASDSHFKEVWAVAGPGQPTTRVFATDRSERAILDALQGGRTTVSAHPLGPVVTLLADADGDGVFEAMGGDEVSVRAGARLPMRLRVERAPGLLVQVWSAPGFVAGPARTFTPVMADETFQLDLPVADGSGWVRADVVDPASGKLLAMVSPVFTTTGLPVQPAPALPVPTPLGLVDAAQPVVTEQGSFAGFPDIATGSRGDVVVAEVHEGGATKVVAVVEGRRVDLAPASQSARFPRVAAAGSDVWVVWQDERAGQIPRRPAVYLRHSPDGGRAWGAEQRLSSGAGRAEHPVVAVHERSPVVAWSDNSRTGAFDVLVLDLATGGTPVAVSAPGKAISPGTPADSRSSRYPASLFPALAVSPTGDVAVAWGDNRFDPDPLFTGRTDLSAVTGLLPDLGTCPGGQCGGPGGPGTAPDNWEVLVVVRPAGSTAFGDPARVTGDDTRADRHPDIAYDASGLLVAVWDSKELRAAGANVSVRSATSADGGKTWTSLGAVGLDEAAMSERPRLSRLATAATQEGSESGGPGKGKGKGKGQDRAPGQGRDRGDESEAPATPQQLVVAWQDTRSADWRWSIQAATFAGGAWSAARRLTGDGNATWPAVGTQSLVFASDRTARVQRDHSWSVQLLTI